MSRRTGPKSAPNRLGDRPKALLLQFKGSRISDLSKWLMAMGYGLTVAEPRHPEGTNIAKSRRWLAIVIDCSKIPSHAREMANYLSEYKGTRETPIILVGVNLHNVQKQHHATSEGGVGYIIERKASWEVKYHHRLSSWG